MTNSKSIKIRTTHNKIAVQVIEKGSNKTASGLIIPDTVTSDFEHGVVLTTGDMVEVLSPGDKVFFNKHSGDDIPIEGIKIMRDIDVSCIIES